MREATVGVLCKVLVLLAHDDASTTVPETCRVLGISRSSYYAALREGRRQALETAKAA